MTNRQRLERVEELLRQERAALLGAIEGLSQPQLDFRRNPRSWSAGQVAHHVGLGEQTWQGYLRELLADGAEKGGRIRRVSLQELSFTSKLIPDFVLRSPLVLEPVSILVRWMPRPLQLMLFAVPLVKFGADPRMQPSGTLSGSELLEYLAQTRKTSLSLIEPHADADLSRFRVIHPLVGDQNVYGILELLANHERRHTAQIRSITNCPGFPAE